MCFSCAASATSVAAYVVIMVCFILFLFLFSYHIAPYIVSHLFVHVGFSVFLALCLIAVMHFNRHTFKSPTERFIFSHPIANDHIVCAIRAIQ